MLTAKKIQVVLLCLIGAHLCVPVALQVCLHIAPKSRKLHKALGNPLYGVTNDHNAKLALTPQSWFDGDFATSTGTWYGQNFPSRNLMVRLNNELNYDLFRNVTRGLFVGKNDQLFEDSYLANDCNQFTPMPTQRLREIVRQMAQLRSRLAKRGVPFVVLLTPSKSAVYPEDVPRQFQNSKTGAPTNYDNFVPLLKQCNVPYSDGLQLLRQLRQTESTPVFCQGGIHWTSYGAFREAQELEGLLNRNGLDLPTMHCDGINWTRFGDAATDGQDYDLAQMCNTFALPVRYSVPQPIVHTDSHAAPTKTLVIVGGSFCWKPLWLYDREKIFKQIRFYFYYHTFQTVFPDHPSPRPVDTAQIDWQHEIFGASAVVLEINVATMNQGVNEHYTAFLDDALKHIDADGRCH